MAKKNVLGKGLDSLIPENIKVEKNEPAGKELLIRISDIEPNKEQPRKKFDEDALNELAESIKQYGIIQPIVVTKPKNGFYEIIAGERRWRAAKLAGLKEVPVIIKDYSNIEIVEIALIENIQRENLNPIEEAIAYKRLLTEFNLKQDEVAERVSKSRVAITNSMRLLNLDERVQEILINEMISMGHARALLGIEDGDEQYNLAMRVFDEKLSVRDIEKIVKAKNNKKKVEKPKEKEVLYQDLEEKLKSIFGTKVTINNKGNKGKIEIEYYSKEDLERIYDLITTV